MSLKNWISLIFFIASAYNFANAMYYWKTRPLFYGIGLMSLVILLGE